MRTKGMIWTVGLCAVLALAMAGAANATVTCPTPGCTGGTPQTCLGVVTTDTGSVDCDPVPISGAGVDASCNNPGAAASNTIIATHDQFGLGPHSHPADPSQCVWGCVDSDGKVFCGITASNSALPVALISFSVGEDDSEEEEEESTPEENED